MSKLEWKSDHTETLKAYDSSMLINQKVKNIEGYLETGTD
jgi:hypothetical protein